jgi:ApbE superfamily uncharacterized protein (UPF0280 family)
MKSDRYQKRFYREWVKAKDLCHAQVTVRQTDLHLLTDTPVDKEEVAVKIAYYRTQIERYIQKNPRFLTSLTPVAVGREAPLIVREMASAARRAGVGPMAAVAGALAQSLGRFLLRKGYRDVIIENGGDIFIKTSKPRLLGIFAGSSTLSRRLSVKIRPCDTPQGICTSSGTVGHSLSFGKTDAAVIFAGNAGLADAVATATANRVHTREDLAAAVGFARSVKGVRAVTIVYRNTFASAGRIEFL